MPADDIKVELVLEWDWVLLDIMVDQEMVDMLAGGPGNGGHVGGNINACVEKPPHKIFRYSEADLQSGVFIIHPQSHE
jgi:hypothetical protein